MPICKAKHIWTSDEYVTAMHRHYSFKFRREFKILLKVACALLLAFVVFVTFIAIVFPYDKPAPYWAFALTAVICVYGLVYHRVNVWYWKRRFRKRPQPTEIEWTFTDDAVQMKTCLGEATVKWEAYEKVLEVRDCFLFYSTRSLFSWIPFSSLESIECIGAIREMIAKSKCPFIQQK
jgi:hypothetical protein